MLLALGRSPHWGQQVSNSKTNFNQKVREIRETFPQGHSSIRVRPNLGLFKFETEKTPR
jgi:hypothetical protein